MLAKIPSNTRGAFPVEIPLRGRIYAAYSRGGFIFAWVVLVMAGLLWLLLLIPDGCIDCLPKSFAGILSLRHTTNRMRQSQDGDDHELAEFDTAPAHNYPSTALLYTGAGRASQQHSRGSSHNLSPRPPSPPPLPLDDE